jgi:hypothetical protein
MARICASCNNNLVRNSYTKNQWAKGDGRSRCHTCVGGGQQPSPTGADQTARRNNAHSAIFTEHDLRNPFAEGAFRHVAEGTFTEGARAGEACVCKWFKTGTVFESHFFATDIQASEKAVDLITKWNSQKLIDKIVQVNLPEVWTFSPESSGDWAGQKVLQEPFIQSYQKFNSNTGWSDDSTPWPRVMQALSHFTYHISNGQCLLCDLQGGVYSNGVVLTDPVVMSTTRVYGPTDLGTNGISTFLPITSATSIARPIGERYTMLCLTFLQRPRPP